MLSDVAGFPAITDTHQLDKHIQRLLRSITVTETDSQ
jgi:hypothetical protein